MLSNINKLPIILNFTNSFTLNSPVYAANLRIPGYGSVGDPQTKFNNIGDVINQALTYVFSFAGIILFIMIISSGFQYLTSSDPKAIEATKKKLTNAIIGFLLVFASYWIMQLIEFSLGGLNVLNP